MSGAMDLAELGYSSDEDIDGGQPINLINSSYLIPKQTQSGKKLSILSMNAQSINNKLQKIRDLTHTCKPTIVAIQETWGKNSLTDYSIKGFHPPVIHPRKGDSMNLGGGVGIWISDKTDFEQINSPFVDKIIESITINLLSLKTIIINLYCPFGDKRECYAKLDSCLLYTSPSPRD